MKSIEQKALETYKINLYYLSKEHVEVHKKIALLDQAIQNGSYEEKYALEYKNGYFDILELSSGNYLYNQDSKKHAKELAKNINFKKSEGVIETFYNQSLSEADAKRIEDRMDIRDPLFAAGKIIWYSNNITSKNDEMKEIVKFIFCGIGVGLHLDEIEKKVKASLLFIMEDNLELFRLSLFSVNYKELSKKAILFFSVMENDTELNRTFNLFLYQGLIHNHYLKYALLTQGDTPKVKRLQNVILASSHLTNPYSKMLLELIKAPEYLVEKYPFIDFSKNYLNTSPLSSKPVLLIASGPSLGKNAKWLQENKDRFFIVAVLSSTRTLHSLGVKPDIVTHLDSLAVSISLFDGIDRESFFDKTLFILSSIISSNVVDSIPKEKVYCIETASNYKQGFRSLTAPSIGEATYGMCLLLGSKELYLLGLDLSLEPETRNTHSKEHIFAATVEKNTIEDEQYASLSNTILYTKGNFLPEVPTTPIYKISADAFNAISKAFLQDEHKVFNLNNGAFLEGASPLHVEDFDTSNLSILSRVEKAEQLKIFFNNISQNFMNESDIENLDKQIQEAQRILDILKEFEKHVSTNNYLVYKSMFNALYGELLNLKNSSIFDINHILFAYFQIVIGYMFDALNTKGLKDEARHIKELNDILTKQLKKMLDIYLKAMRVYKEWAVK